MSGTNLPVDLTVNDRTVQALTDKLVHIQHGQPVLNVADAWGETVTFGRKHQNRCPLIRYPCWYIQRIFGRRSLKQTDIERFNAVADDDSSSPFSSAS